MKKMSDTLSRQWTMLKHIPAHPRWISTKAIHQYLESEGYDISLRTVQRDLDKTSSDFPLVDKSEGTEKYWQWAKDAHALEIPSMTASTALVFTLAERYLEPMLPGSTLDLIAPYLARAREVMKTTRFRGWRKNVRLLNRGPRLITPPVNPGIRDVVFSSLLEKSRFNAVYRRRECKDETQYVVNPLGLVVKEGIHYLVCTLWDYKDIKHLALHRFRSAELIDTPAVRHRDFDLDTYIEKNSSFAYPVGDGNLKLKFRMTPTAAFHLRESRLSKDQEIKELKDGNIQVSATVPDNSEIRWWLLGFGDQVEILAPTKLRKEFSKTARRLAELYH